MKRLLFPLMLMVLLAADCQLGAVPPTKAPATSVPPTVSPPTATTAPTTGPTSVPATTAPNKPTTAPSEAAPTGTPIRVDLTQAQLAAVKALASKLKISADRITVVSTEAVDWPDGCLGVVQPGVTCAKGPVPGFRIKLSASGREYEYHTNQEGTSVLSTEQDSQPLRVMVQLVDSSRHIMDTGFAAGGVRLNQGMLPLGGSVGGTAYVIAGSVLPKAEMVDATGTKELPFVKEPNFGLAVWPGIGADKPRLAWWSTARTDIPSVSQLFIASVDGSSVTAVLTETVTRGQVRPYELAIERWSDDGQAVYFSREPYGIGTYTPFIGASSLYRYNLADKSVTELFPFYTKGSDAGRFPDVDRYLCLDDFMPDANLLAGHCADPKTITVHDMSGGRPDQTITAPPTVTDYSRVGGARFSPDGKRVAFALAKGDPNGEQGYVAVSDGLAGQSKLVTTSDTGHFYTVVAWLNDSTLLLQLNTLTCIPDCNPSLWTIGIDGANLTKVSDGAFLTFVAGK